MAKASEVTKSSDIAEKVEKPVNEVENTEQPADSVSIPTLDPAALHSLDTLAALHRVPGWQAAAVARSMGWEGGKQVTYGEYQNALASLNTRRMGGQ